MISIIVPVYNEGDIIIPFLESLLALHGEKELILVDGGSTDDTFGKVVKYIASHNIKHAHIVTSDAGRGVQMNKGASLSRGDILWFLHADSELSKTSLQDIEQSVARGGHYGCFKLHFYDSNKAIMKIIAWGSHLRAKKSKLIFGDQGMFIRRALFEEVGCFPSQAIMEDYQISLNIKKLKKKSPSKIKADILPTLIGTSARRFINNGILYVFFKIQYIKLLYILGASPSQISRIYRGKRV